MIVVTGATGHIGSVLIRELVSKGERLRAIVPPFEDISSIYKSLIKAFNGAEYVYHLAGIISIS
ncbi:MAG TPA: NAD-dependent epimerase/dehydratase family protein [Clostridia bacterium]|nr:NAD-dependent epimerase/dehydratase family protein [Clostridia bacterium]